MISGTHLLSGALLALSAWMFKNGDLTAFSQTFVWVVIFFFASAGASAAHLHRERDVADRDPLRGDGRLLHDRHDLWRIGPVFHSALIGDGSSRTGLFIGYLVGADIMIIGGIVELLIGINAEGKSLER